MRCQCADPLADYYYAWGGDKRMYAYARDEWGMGGSLPKGGIRLPWMTT